MRIRIDWAKVGGWVIILLMSLAVIAICMFAGGCRSVEQKTYYETGQLKSEYKSDGCINWSDGDGKQLPFSNISVSGVGK